MEDIKNIFYVLVCLYWIFSVVYLAGLVINSEKEMSLMKGVIYWIFIWALGWFLSPIMLGFKLSEQHAEKE